jgi:hypothetical protein
VGLARLYIRPDVLLGLLHGRYEVVTHGLPVDATIHTCVCQRLLPKGSSLSLAYSQPVPED